eukprot:3057982-Karenia_brevis.AAC.1
MGAVEHLRPFRGFTTSSLRKRSPGFSTRGGASSSVRSPLWNCWALWSGRRCSPEVWRWHSCR